MSIRTRASGRLRGSLALLVAASILLAVAAPHAGAAEPESSFCVSRTLHDYLTPFKRMPKLRELPYHRQQGQGFRGIEIETAGPALAIGGGRAGYEFNWFGKNPGWDVTLTFAQVNASGSVIRQIGTRHVEFSHLKPGYMGIEPRFNIPSGPAFYRTTLVIRSNSGRKLAEFGNYYRVVKPKIDASLVADAPSYLPGGTLFARIENPGAAIVLFGEEFFVEALQGGAWIPAPGTPGPFPAPLGFIAAGVSSKHCLSFPIPATMPTGTYRISQETVVGWFARATEIRPKLYAEFEVTP